jgi:hypothetical protein
MAQNFRKKLLDRNFLFAVAAKQVPGCDIVNMKGRNDAVGAFDKPVDLAPHLVAGGVPVEYNFPPLGGIAMKVKSTDPADTDVTLRVYLLDTTGADNGFIDLALTGTSFLALPGTPYRINGSRIIGNQLLRGTVDIVDAATGLIIYSRIEPRLQTHWTGIYTIPLGFFGYVVNLIASIRKGAGSDDEAQINICSGSPEMPRGEEFAFGLQKSGDTIVDLVNRLPDEVDTLTDICMSGESSPNSVAMLARLGILIVDENLLTR